MSTTINLKEKTVEGLKALAYDVQKVITNYQNSLSLIENEIANRATQEESPQVAQSEPQPGS